MTSQYNSRGISNLLGPPGVQYTTSCGGDRSDADGKATLFGSGKRCEMTERKKRTPGRTTVKLGLIAKVERLKDKVHAAQNAQDIQAAKHIDRIGKLETEMKEAEAALTQFQASGPMEVETVAGMASDDDNVRFGGTDG